MTVEGLIEDMFGRTDAIHRLDDLLGESYLTGPLRVFIVPGFLGPP
jgi:hypothetical protein